MSLLSHNLQAFLAVSRASTVQGAAKSIGLTQTGVTQRIRGLEKELGISLFLRSRKGMSLTHEGRALLQYCIAAEEIEGKANAVIYGSGVEQSVSITIAGPTSIMNARIVNQCIRLYSRWPKLNLNFHIDDKENRIELLKRGNVEFVLVRPFEVTDELDSKLLKPEKFVLVGHPRLKGLSMEKLLTTERVIDFSHEDPTTINYLNAFGFTELMKNPRIFTNNNETLTNLLVAGIGIGTLTREVAESFLRNKKLICLNSGKHIDDPIALAWYPRSEKPEYFSDIIRSIF